MGFSRQEYWRGLPCPPPGGLPDPGRTHISYVSCIGRPVLYHWCHFTQISVPILVQRSVRMPPSLKDGAQLSFAVWLPQRHLVLLQNVLG